MIRVRSIITKTIIIGDKERAEQMIRLNRQLRGQREAQPCTCAVNHGWHA